MQGGLQLPPSAEFDPATLAANAAALAAAAAQAQSSGLQSGLQMHALPPHPMDGEEQHMAGPSRKRSRPELEGGASRAPLAPDG